ncbi:MAG: 4-(cytidine 5'-diphospho)-2-C-methyl-D-erythritol kinase [Candidatus Krumholzibacteria bacterium]|nr:4-(cytidine 5'-diphospho)-2-C-methyl-D-erythritol kinase [Candidatus Krumholzibacteria bacterium]
MTLSARCAAKINLYLDIIGTRDDGYHEIETIFQPVSLWDELTFSAVDQGLEVTGDDDSVPWNGNNLCARAARVLFDRVGFRRGVRIDVHKEIPVGAGLGGGSSDAAATLLGLNELFGFALSNDKLQELALRVGSDVPFFVMGRPAIGRGRGEILEEVSGLPGGWILIVKPDITISTKRAYENVNLVLTQRGYRDKLKKLLKGLEVFPDSRLDTLNSFEDSVIESFPEIGKVLATLRSSGAVLSALSGSGSSCFAVFSEENRAKEAGRVFISKGFITRIARPVNTAIELIKNE